MKSLFIRHLTCPICNKSEAVATTPEPANFFRCGECHQAIKLNKQGRLVPWLDVYSAGLKRSRAGPA